MLFLLTQFNCNLILFDLNYWHMNLLQRLLLALLLGVLQPCFAMQLGAAKGAAVFGRPLDLTIPVRFDTPVEDPFNCFSADIFQADTKFDAGRVRLDVTPATNGLDAVVRIRSNTAVIEPWAKVILRNNCGAKVTRQYDFLTDFVADMPAINPQTESVANNNLPSTNTVSNLSAKQSAQTATVSNALPLLPSAPVSNWSVKRAQESSQATNRTSTQEPSKPRRTIKPNAAEPKPTAFAVAPANPLGKVAHLGQSRLKMETFELTDEHQVLLKLSTAMIAPTGMRTPEEIQALAQATAVWRAINGMPAVTAATVALPASVAANTAAATATAAITKPTAMVKDEKHELNNPIVYGLMGLLALTLACITWLWFHVRRGTQPGYGWLQEKAMVEAPVKNEPTQYIPTSFTETAFVPEALVDEVARFNEVTRVVGVTELANTELEEPLTHLAEAGFDDSPLAVLLSHKEVDTLNRKETLNKTISTSKEFSATNSPEKSPEHFDDSRFDDKQLITKFNMSLVQEDIINAQKESVDFVVSDASPKLRSVPTPVIAVDSETELNLAPTQPEKVTTEPTKASINSPKKELVKELPKEQSTTSKGNLIDFDVFSESAPLPKPSRFSR